MSEILDDMIESYPQLVDVPVRKAFEILLNSCAGGGKVLVCGNGGSASDSEHIVGELVKGFLLKRKLPAHETARFVDFGKPGSDIASRLQGGIPAIALNSQSSLLTAVGNDTSFDMVFAQQVYVYGKKNDALIAMTTLGNSKNIVNAALTAKALGMAVIGITGQSSGELGRYCDVCLALPSNQTYRIQELTLPVYHALCAMLEQALFAEE